jgi:hypothetical protein
VLFSTPVSISANAVYVAAYFSSAGNYISTANYFTAALVNGSITALADGTSGFNGVYMYTTTPAFPSNGFNKSNYWVDVIFNAGTSGNTIQQMQLTGEVTTADTAVAQTPVQTQAPENPGYNLGQNHPNPFSQKTIINYIIPSPAFVEIALFDTQGRLISVLVNEQKDGGSYQYELNKASLAKGIYYYRMRSGNFIATRKMAVQ